MILFNNSSKHKATHITSVIHNIYFNHDIREIITITNLISAAEYRSLQYKSASVFETEPKRNCV